MALSNAVELGAQGSIYARTASMLFMHYGRED
jgi:hypothetical protein